jgi:hypothetical protein
MNPRSARDHLRMTALSHCRVDKTEDMRAMMRDNGVPVDG